MSREFTTYFRSVQGLRQSAYRDRRGGTPEGFQGLLREILLDDMDRYDEIMAKEAKAALIVCVDIEHISGQRSHGTGKAER